MKNEEKINIIRPFGPGIGLATIPKILVDKINNFVDEVVKDKKKSKDLDYGHKLAGEVTQEIFLPSEMLQGEILNFFVSIWKSYVEILTNKKLTKFNLIRCWVVRQFEGEYNPAHWHGGHISGVAYLKLPDSFGDNIQKNKKINKHGDISFIHGQHMFLCDAVASFKPKVGDFYIFPNYLIHSVNPFYSSGERRSISFNGVIDNDIYDVYSSK